MMNPGYSTGLKRSFALGIALIATGCNVDGLMGGNDARVRLVLSREGGSNPLAAIATSAIPSDAQADKNGDPHPNHSAWSFQSANVTLSSVMVRTLDGELIPLEVDMPFSVDVVKIDGGREVQLPDGVLPVGSYDQVVLVMTAVQGEAADGTLITIEPPGGGWTAVIPICAFDVAEGETATVGLTLNVRNSFLRVGSHWSFLPRFRPRLECPAAP